MQKFSLLRTTVGDCYRVDYAKEKRAVKEKQKVKWENYLSRFRKTQKLKQKKTNH